MQTSTTDFIAVLIFGLLIAILSMFGLWDIEFDGLGLV